MKTLLASAAVVGALLVAGTANAQNAAQCQQYATNYAEQQYPTGGGAVGGALFGGILGAGIAAATGNNVGGGVGVGAASGLVVGSVAWQNAKRQAYERAYTQCITGTTQAFAPAPPVYAPAIYPTGAFNGVIVGASAVNVRSGPGTNYPVLGQVVANQGISVATCGGGWCQIYFGPGAAFVSQTYVRPL
jgi:uncharacterized protein YgiM (DUF1202 family)